MRKPRDLELLDRLEEYEGVSYSGAAWRATRAGRDPLAGYASRSRWDPGGFDVLYTSLRPEGAIAEMHYDLSLQPVFPSKKPYELSELKVGTVNSLRLVRADLFEALGVEKSTFKSLDYARTQEISDAAYFLGFDGLLVPSARSKAENLVLFNTQLKPDSIELIGTDAIVWKDWEG